jgi:hypothetical protein
VFFDAWLNDWRQHEAFFQGMLSNEQRREILGDLFIDDERLRNVLDGWRCPQWDLLIIDERERYQYVVACQTIIHRTLLGLSMTGSQGACSIADTRVPFINSAFM